MTKKEFTSLTREELIEGIIEMQDPDIASHKRLHILVNYDNDNGEPTLALKIRDGKYFVAEFDWRYYNDEDTVELKQELVSREVFRQHMYDSLKNYSLNVLRTKYHVARGDQWFVKNDEETKKKIDTLLQYTAHQRLELFKRITKVSHIPNEFTLVGKVKDKIIPQIIEDLNLDTEISIWQAPKGNVILTVNKESRYIECLAVKDLESVFVFDEESEEGLRAIIDVLSDPQPDEQ